MTTQNYAAQNSNETDAISNSVRGEAPRPRGADGNSYLAYLIIIFLEVCVRRACVGHAKPRSISYHRS